MDEFDFYQGTHTGGEIDLTIDIVDGRSSTVHDPSYFATNSGDNLFTEWGTFKAIENRIVEITISSITGNGTVEGTAPQIGPIGGYTAEITDRHKVLAYQFSNPSAVTGNWTITAGSGSVTYSGSINGTTDLTLILGCIGQDVQRFNLSD